MAISFLKVYFKKHSISIFGSMENVDWPCYFFTRERTGRIQT